MIEDVLYEDMVAVEMTEGVAGERMFL